MSPPKNDGDERIGSFMKRAPFQFYSSDSKEIPIEEYVGGFLDDPKLRILPISQKGSLIYLTSPAFFPVPVRQAAPSRVERETRFVMSEATPTKV